MTSYDETYTGDEDGSAELDLTANPEFIHALNLAGPTGRHARERALELLSAHTDMLSNSERTQALLRVFLEVHTDPVATLALLRAMASYGAALAEVAAGFAEELPGTLSAGALIGGLAHRSLTLD